jgi:Fe2+ transport system protein FeoA
VTLDQLSVNSEATIKELVRNDLTSKLTDMGLYPGKQIRVLYRAPFGDPIAVDVEGYTLSLRKNEASLVELS